jgi:hypothetical protein
MAGDRHVNVIYCDDIRHEIGNKLSFIGIYAGELLVQSFPITLPKLCLFVSISTPSERPFQQLRLRILKDEEVLLESEIPQQQVLAAVAAAKMQALQSGGDDPTLTAHLELVATPLSFTAPARIRVRVNTESEELKGRALRVMQQQPPTVAAQPLNS